MGDGSEQTEAEDGGRSGARCGRTCIIHGYHYHSVAEDVTEAEKCSDMEAAGACVHVVGTLQVEGPALQDRWSSRGVQVG